MYVTALDLFCKMFKSMLQQEVNGGYCHVYIYTQT